MGPLVKVPDDMTTIISRAFFSASDSTIMMDSALEGEK
jgi:hypothetical protein